MKADQDYIFINCPICNSSESKEVYPDTLGTSEPRFDYNFSKDHSRTYRVLKCQVCGHGYCSPRAKIFTQHYKDVIDDTYLKNRTQRIWTARNVLKYLLIHAPGGRLLDIGCATGDFLEVACRAYMVEGLEVSKWSVNIARNRGFLVHETMLDHFRCTVPYNVITLWGVIEHFEDPNSEIDRIAKILKPGGIVGLWTGDFDCLLSKFLKKKWWWIQGQHINIFTKKSLRTLFENHHFKPVYFGIYPYVITAQSLKTSLGRYSIIAGLTNNVLSSGMLNHICLTLKIPGEMFAIFQKA